jgi:hypothetical protein
MLRQKGGVMTLDISRPLWPSGVKRIALVSIPAGDQLIAYAVDLDRHRLVLVARLLADEREELINNLRDGYAMANRSCGTPEDVNPPAPGTPPEESSENPPPTGAAGRLSTPADGSVVVIPGTGPQAHKSSASAAPISGAAPLAAAGRSGATEADVVVIPGTGPQAHKSSASAVSMAAMGPLGAANTAPDSSVLGTSRLRQPFVANRTATKPRVRARRLASKAQSPTAGRRLIKKTRTSR